MITEESVLETLRRVPDRIILATMGRELNLTYGNECLCGWFVREKIAEMRNVGASTVSAFHDGPVNTFMSIAAPKRSAVVFFGGTESEWDDIYRGAADEPNAPSSRLPIIERAFVRRVDEAVNAKRARRSR